VHKLNCKLNFAICKLNFVIILLVLGGCGLGSGPPTTPTPDLSADEIAQRTSQAMLESDTFHFDIVLTGALDYIDRPPTTALKRVTGNLLRPDKLKAIVRVSTLGLVSEVGLISIEQDSYVTNPLNQQWQKLPPEWGWYFDPRAPFNEEYGIPAVVPLVPMQKLGLAEIEGQSYYHLQGTAQGEQITIWTAGLIADGDVPITLWIDPQTFLIRRVTMVETSSDPEKPTTWQIDFTEYGNPVEVQAPPIE